MDLLQGGSHQAASSPMRPLPPKLPLNVSSPRTKQLGYLRVREDHIGIALQGVEVVVGKSIAGFGWDEQGPGLVHQRVNVGGRERLLFLQGFVHGDDEFGKRVQPGKPGVVGKEL